jgi:lysozyme family protein
MRGNFEQCLALTLKEEGGFANNPKDPGGMTNLGVTRATYEQWLGRHVTDDEMRALTIKDVEPIYRTNYWDRVRGDELPVGVDLVVFDLAVNSGTTRAAKFLQQALNVPSDGIIGPKTLAACQQRDPEELIEQICQERLQFLKQLSTWETFGKGWTNRITRIEAAAKKMLASLKKPPLKNVSANVA